jgi:hypothetical protein
VVISVIGLLTEMGGIHLKRNAINSTGSQMPPHRHLSKTEVIVYNAITSQSNQESNQNLVEQVIEITKFSELQVRAALFLLLQKDVISSDEIIDTDI